MVVLALRERGSIAVAAGSNSLTLTGKYSHYRLTGATGAFTIGTLAAGNDGELVTLINTTGKSMTISSAGGILTGTGSSITSSNGTGYSSVTMIYNATIGRWVVSGTSGMSSGDAWALLGNSSTVDGTNFIGTTDNVPLNFRVNNQKAGRIDATNVFLGNVAGYNSNALTAMVAIGDSAAFAAGGPYATTAVGYRRCAITPRPCR
jgi:hypothetical protein